MSISDRMTYQAGMRRQPLYGNFELSPLCNFACGMCYVRRSPAEVKARGGLIPAQRWLEWAKAGKEAGLLWLLLTGGEPFLYPGFLELYEELAGLGLVLSINSNGALIDDRAIKALKRNAPKRINITLYGASEASYASLCGDPEGFRRVRENITRLRENGIRFRFNCSLTRQNYRELPELVEFARQCRTSLEIASYMFPPRRRGTAERDESCWLTAEEAGACAAEGMRIQLAEDAFDRYTASVRKVAEPPAQRVGEGMELACRAGRCSFWVNWQGRLCACGMMENPSRSLLELEFDQAWEAVVQEVDRLRVLKGCSGCPNLGVCRPCAAMAYCETGSVNGRPEYKCKMLQAEAAASHKILKQKERAR